MQVSDKPVLAGAAIPEGFLPLYRNLDETLRQAGVTYPFKKRNDRPLVAPNLVMASRMYPLAAPDSQRRKDLLVTLNAYQAMGAGAVLSRFWLRKIPSKEVFIFLLKVARLQSQRMSMAPRR